MKAPTLARRLFTLVLAGGGVLAAWPLSAQNCSSFTWSVTASPAGPGTAAVRICGRFAGCRPHNPQSTVDGSVIRVYLTQAELPECICIAIVDNFEIATTVPGLEPRDYSIEVVRVSCGEQEVAGTGSFAAGGTSVPTLDEWGLSGLALLLAGTAIWRLRT